MKLFKCSVCAEKDSRIKDLKEQLAFFKAQYASQTSSSDVPMIHLEADGIISGQSHVIDIPDSYARSVQAEEQEADEAQSEAARILSGTY